MSPPPLKLRRASSLRSAVALAQVGAAATCGIAPGYRSAHPGCRLSLSHGARSTSSGCSGYFGGEVSVGPIDPFTKSVAHKPDNPYRGASIGFRLLQCLSDALVRLMDERLVQQ